VSGRVPVEISVDALLLRGEHWRGSSLFAVLVHDQGEDLDSWRDIPEQLATVGASVIAFDLRGHGGSDGHPAIVHAIDDIEATVNVAREAGAEGVVVVASGTSGYAALGSSADAVIAITPLVDRPTKSVSAGRPHARLVIASANEASESAVAAVQSESGRRTLVARVPVDDVGLTILDGRWGSIVASYILAFVRQIGQELALRRSHGEPTPTSREDVEQWT
jgi:alpha-beta hydrolase superfamily lysophospholipase